MKPLDAQWSMQINGGVGCAGESGNHAGTHLPGQKETAVSTFRNCPVRLLLEPSQMGVSLGNAANAFHQQAAEGVLGGRQLPKLLY